MSAAHSNEMQETALDMTLCAFYKRRIAEPSIMPLYFFS